MTVGANYFGNNVTTNGKVFANDIFILTLQSVFSLCELSYPPGIPKQLNAFFGTKSSVGILDSLHLLYFLAH